jgi:hypothetical protein
MEASLLTNPGDLMGDEEFALIPHALAPVQLFDADIPHTTSQNSGISVPDVFVDTVNTTIGDSNGVDDTSGGNGGDPEEVDYNAVRDILAISGIIDQSGALRMEMRALVRVHARDGTCLAFLFVFHDAANPSRIIFNPATSTLPSLSSAETTVKPARTLLVISLTLTTTYTQRGKAKY